MNQGLLQKTMAIQSKAWYSAQSCQTRLLATPGFIDLITMPGLECKPIHSRPRPGGVDTKRLGNSMPEESRKASRV